MSILRTHMGWAAALPAQVAATETSSDEVLIRRIADGDQLAMRTLFARYRVAIYRWLLRLVGDEALAEDLLSDVFLDVWRKAASFEARSSVSTWLLAIARYKALSARRQQPHAELNDELASTVADPADDPEFVLQKKDRAELLPGQWFHPPTFHFASGQISGTSLPLWVQGSTVTSISLLTLPRRVLFSCAVPLRTFPMMAWPPSFTYTCACTTGRSAGFSPLRIRPV